MSIVNVPASALVPSGRLYTDIIGGGIGAVVVMDGFTDGRSDDGSSDPVGLGFTLNLLGVDAYTQMWINVNGNVSFGGANHSIPVDTLGTGLSGPVIAPFFADADARPSGSGVVHLRTDVTGTLIVTWDGIARAEGHTDTLNRFQLVLRGPTATVARGEGVIGFFWKEMQWETADSHLSNPGTAGISADSSHQVNVVGAGVVGIAAILENHYIWFDSHFAPVLQPTGLPPLEELPGALGEADFGVDIDVLNDLPPNLTLVGGQRNIAQAIARRLVTPEGFLRDTTGDQQGGDYGFDVRSLLNSGLSASQIAYIGRLVERQCLLDPRIDNADVVASFDPETSTIRLDIGLTAADGPFDLVLQVSALTVTILDAG